MVDALYDAVGAALREECHRLPVGEDGLLRHHALHQHVWRDGDAFRRRHQPHDDDLFQSAEGVEKGLHLGRERSLLPVSLAFIWAFMVRDSTIIITGPQATMVNGIVNLRIKLTENYGLNL